MAVECPYCRYALSLKKPKPGRFAAACPERGRKFQVMTADDPEQSPIVTGAPAGSEALTREATGSPASWPRAGRGSMPAVLGGYRVVKELGRGGMGAVYLARQLSLNRNVALKVMKPQWASN